MKRLNIAMLGEQQMGTQVVIDENNEALATDQDAAELQQQGAEIDEMQSVVNETRDASDSIRQTAQVIEQMPEVSQEVVQVAQEQIAYFVKRTGMKMSGVSSAVESYVPNKKGNKEALVKQMSLASESLDASISIAQEGIIDRIKNRFSLLFTTSEKLEKELVMVSKDYDDKGAKEGVIKDPAFARRLNQDKKSQLSEQDVLSLAEDVDKKFHNPNFLGSLKKITEAFDKVAQALEKSNFLIADDDAVRKIQEQQDVLMKIYQEAIPEMSVSRKKASCDVEPLTPVNKQKVTKLVESLLDKKAYERYIDDLNDSIHVVHNKLLLSDYTKLAGKLAKDNRNAREALRHGDKVLNLLGDVYTLRFEVAHACVKYIKASTAN